MVVRPDDPRPAYVQVADDLRQQIETGQLQPGQRLPSMRDLARIYEIAYMTAQHAVRVLREQGIVVAHQGRGAFVEDQQQLTEALGARQPHDPATRDPAGDGAPATLDDVMSMLRVINERLDRIERERGHDSGRLEPDPYAPEPPAPDPGLDIGP